MFRKGKYQVTVEGRTADKVCKVLGISREKSKPLVIDIDTSNHRFDKPCIGMVVHYHASSLCTNFVIVSSTETFNISECAKAQKVLSIVRY